MAENGYFKVSRKLFNEDNQFWENGRPRTRFEAWLDLINLARYKSEPQKVIIGNKVILCHQGELLRSVKSLSERWIWNESAVRRFLNILIETESIKRANEVVTTRITIVNYSKYQVDRRPNEVNMKINRRASEFDLTTEEGKRIKVIKDNYEGFARFDFDINRFEKLLMRFKSMRPDINFDLELQSASVWLSSNNQNAKKKKDLILTLNNWFKKKVEDTPLPEEEYKETIEEMQERLANMAVVEEDGKGGFIEVVYGTP